MNDLTKDLCNGIYALLTLAIESPRLSVQDRIDLLSEVITDCELKLEGVANPE